MNKTLFVAGTPAVVEDQVVAEAFAQYGNVESIRRIEDKRDASLCILFVTMETEDAAFRAVKGRTVISGNTLNVQEAKPKKQTTSRSGYRRGGYKNEIHHSRFEKGSAIQRLGLKVTINDVPFELMDK